MAGKIELKEKLGLTQFGLVFASFFLILHLVLEREDKFFIFVALVFLVAAIFFHRLLKPLNKIWLGFGEIIGKIVGSIILAIVFYVFLTPFAMLRDCFGGKKMNISFDDPSPSFWVVREAKQPDRKEFERQF